MGLKLHYNIKSKQKALNMPGPERRISVTGVKSHMIRNKIRKHNKRSDLTKAIVKRGSN